MTWPFIIGVVFLVALPFLVKRWCRHREHFYLKKKEEETYTVTCGACGKETISIYTGEDNLAHGPCGVACLLEISGWGVHTEPLLGVVYLCPKCKKKLKGETNEPNDDERARRT